MFFNFGTYNVSYEHFSVITVTMYIGCLRNRGTAGKEVENIA